MISNMPKLLMDLPNTTLFLKEWSTLHPVHWVLNDSPIIWITNRRKRIGLTIIEENIDNDFDYLPNRQLLRKAIQADINLGMPKVIKEYIESIVGIKDKQL